MNDMGGSWGCDDAEIGRQRRDFWRVSDIALIAGPIAAGPGRDYRNPVLTARARPFVFRKAAALKPAGALSGGERLRAALACPDVTQTLALGGPSA